MGPPSVEFRRKAGGVEVKLEKTETERLRREDCRRVKHDKLFSDWKILVGSADWRSHAAEEEGSHRYQLHNLPTTYFGPGVYELGLTLQDLRASREARPRKLKRQDVIVVYLGQAENVRQRLQKYGQSGSHLENVRLVPGSAIGDCEYDDQKRSPSVTNTRAKTNGSCAGHSAERGLRLFTDVFSRGYSIVFRYARTESKQMAEKVESELLHVFDYPWNRGLNGARRPDEILARLELMQYHLEKSLCLGGVIATKVAKWDLFRRKVGIVVPVKKPLEEGSSGRSRFSIFMSSAKPGQEASLKPGPGVCGVALQNGSLCSSVPVKGRKRCAQHKGLRAKRTTRRARTGNTKSNTFTGQIMNKLTPDIYKGHSGSPPVLIVKSTPNGKRLEFSDAPPSDGLACGVTLESGTVCLNVPVKDRKRCAAHKGMRTGRQSSVSPETNQRKNCFTLPSPTRTTNQREKRDTVERL